MFRFFFRSLLLAPQVFLRMLPVFAVAGFAIFLFLTEIENPVIFWPMLLGGYAPFLAFLALCAVRAGLVSLRSTTAPSLQSLYQMMWYFLRFNANLSIGLSALLALPLSALVLHFLDPEVLDDILRMIRSLNVRNAQRTLGQLMPYVLPLGLVWGAALSLAFGITGAAMGATAASAAGRIEQHDRFWGYGRQFPRLATLAMVTLLVPFVPIAQHVIPKIPDATLRWPPDEGLIAVGITVGYLTVALCVLASGAALAYVTARAEDELRKRIDTDEMIGPNLDRDQIRALRAARQHQRDGGNWR